MNLSFSHELIGWKSSAFTPMLPDDATLLLADDDSVSCGRLGQELSALGFDLVQANTVQEALTIAREDRPKFAVVELRFGGGSGLQVVQALREARPEASIVILTGYGNIASAVSAVKAGVRDFITKPSSADEVARALLADDTHPPSISDHAMSAARVRWEHIQRVLELCDGNVSDAARRMSMHRRTLQRILSKRPPR